MGGMIQITSHRRSLKQSIDWRIVGCYLILILIGWVSIYSSIHSTEPSSIFDWSARSGKQFIWIVTAFVIDTIILLAVNPGIWEVISTPAYCFVMLLLVAVIFLGVEVKGSHSWFALGPVRFQPAEISKITTAMLLAMYLSRPGHKITDRRTFLVTSCIIMLPMLIILAESETGSALVYVGFAAVLYREGLSGWLLTIMGMAVLIFILTLTTVWWVPTILVSILTMLYLWRMLRKMERSPKLEKLKEIRKVALAFACGMVLIFATGFIFENVLQDHQRKRIEVLLGMKEDPSGVGYNVRQSMIAIGSGGFAGKGYLNGTQTSYGFVPEQSTDFIFCTIGEEWGFIGCLAVILIYVYLIYRIIKDAEECRSAFTRIYGYSLAACLFMHLFINVGMTIGLMPVIGIPLPLLSYGGSSLWAFSIMLFVFLALYRREKVYF